MLSRRTLVAASFGTVISTLPYRPVLHGFTLGWTPHNVEAKSSGGKGGDGKGGGSDNGKGGGDNGKGGGSDSGKGGGSDNGKGGGSDGKGQSDGKDGGGSGNDDAGGDNGADGGNGKGDSGGKGTGADEAPGGTVDNGAPDTATPDAGELGRADIEVEHSNGMSEKIEAGRYVMRDARGRTIINRRATRADIARLRDSRS